jgi:hypothetical protein
MAMTRARARAKPMRRKKSARFVCANCEQDLPSSECAHNGGLIDRIIGTRVWFPHCHACLASLGIGIPPAVEAYLVRKHGGGRFLATADQEGHLLPAIELKHV